MAISDFLFVTKWWIVLLILGFSFLPLTYKIFNPFIDKGYLFSKIIGLLITTYLIYLLGTFHLLKFTTLNIFIVWVVSSSILLFIFRKIKLDLRKNLKIFIFEEFIFFACLLAWSLIRAYQPDIHDLEKFMDFGFVNSILRSEYFPPKDMWLTPHSINYYYFGHLFTAVLTKISSIPSYISFNLMIATIFAFCFSLSLSIGVNLITEIKKISLRKTFIFGFLFAYLVALAGNLQTIYSFFKNYNGENPVPFWTLNFSPLTFPNSYWYPNATRFIFHTIHEFPSYSFVVADLHGHVLDIPVVISLIGIALVMFLEKKVSFIPLIFSSFLISVAYMTNAWDGLIYLALFSFIIIGIQLLTNKSNYLKNIFISFINSGKYILFIGILFYIFTFIFSQNFIPFASNIGLNCSFDFLIKIEKFGPFVFEKGQCQHSPIWQLGILYGFFFFMTMSFFIYIRNKKASFADYFIGIISIFSFLLLTAPEFIYLKDIYTGHFRANTMFKLSYQAFIMLSFSSTYIIFRILNSYKESVGTKMGKVCNFIFISFGLFLLFFISIYPYFSIPSGYGDLKTYKGLDGIKYLSHIKPSDYQAIKWINENIKDQPVILEAQGDSYTDFARISANTGLPTVLGWTVHEWLWRGSYDIPASRFTDIQNLYESTNRDLTKKLIDKYDISYIYIGGLEREKYKVNENKFELDGKLIYSKGQSKIYKVN